MLCTFNVKDVKSVAPRVCADGVRDIAKSPMLNAAERVVETTPSVRFTEKG